VVNGQHTPVYVLTSSGWLEMISGIPLETLAYDTGTATTVLLGNFSMTDLGLESGDTLVYGYVYTDGSIANLVVENMVTINVK
jgi:hypothetical protein